jgi:polar amino acid transport system substrate-binding protein
MSASFARDLAPTGVLRASINLGNPVLAQGTGDAPSGITVDLSHEIAARLGVPVSFSCFDAARDSFGALRDGAADIAFLAIEPARAAEVWFTEPYALIEGVYAVPGDSAINDADGVDRPGVRVGVKEGSAYDLFLSRTLTRAEVVRGRDGIDAFRDHGLEVAAGIRQPLARIADDDPSLRMLEPAFMQIRQAVAAPRELPSETRKILLLTVEALKANGFVARALERSGQDAALTAPPAVAGDPRVGEVSRRRE